MSVTHRLAPAAGSERRRFVATALVPRRALQSLVLAGVLSSMVNVSAAEAQEARGSITVEKEAAGAYRTFAFRFTTGDGVESFKLGNDDWRTFAELDPGRYVVREIDVSGWQIGDVAWLLTRHPRHSRPGEPPRHDRPRARRARHLQVRQYQG